MNERIESHLTNVDVYVKELNSIYMTNTNSYAVPSTQAAGMITDLLREMELAVQNIYSTDKSIQKSIGKSLDYLNIIKENIQAELQNPSHTILEGIYINQVYPTINTLYEFCKGDLNNSELQNMFQPA